MLKKRNLKVNKLISSPKVIQLAKWQSWYLNPVIQFPVPYSFPIPQALCNQLSRDWVWGHLKSSPGEPDTQVGICFFDYTWGVDNIYKTVVSIIIDLNRRATHKSKQEIKNRKTTKLFRNKMFCSSGKCRIQSVHNMLDSLGASLEY